MLLIHFLVIAATSFVSLANNCVSRDFGESSIVCVCNATFCDTLPSVENVSKGSYQLVISSQSGLRFEVSTGQFSNRWQLPLNTITIDRSRTYQKIEGFGGAFTDSTGINIKSLSEGAQEHILNSYFSTNGSEYTLGRVPIAGTDFSTRGYSYADGSPGSLDSFSLQEEDYKYKIPIIKTARNITNGALKLLASPWSSPPWMKANNAFSGSSLLTEYYQLWADYILKFFEAYDNEGVQFWSFTLQNEPLTGFLGSTIWLPSELIGWLKTNIGPTLRNSNYSYINILIIDDQRIMAPFAQLYFEDPDAFQYVDGVAYHWYFDDFVPPFYLDFGKSTTKDIFFIYSESSNGFSVVPHVILGDWSRGAKYASDIIDVLNKDGVGWIDWNLALDAEGGPSYISDFLDSPIIVNATVDEFYKQPMYYTIAHFSKYIPRGSERIGARLLTAASVGLKATAFVRPDNKTVLTILNNANSTQSVQIRDEYYGYINLSLEEQSLNSIIY